MNQASLNNFFEKAVGYFSGDEPERPAFAPYITGTDREFMLSIEELLSPEDIKAYRRALETANGDDIRKYEQLALDRSRQLEKDRQPTPQESIASLGSLVAEPAPTGFGSKVNPLPALQAMAEGSYAVPPAPPTPTPVGDERPDLSAKQETKYRPNAIVLDPKSGQEGQEQWGRDVFQVGLNEYPVFNKDGSINRDKLPEPVEPSDFTKQAFSNVRDVWDGTKAAGAWAYNALPEFEDVIRYEPPPLGVDTGVPDETGVPVPNVPNTVPNTVPNGVNPFQADGVELGPIEDFGIEAGAINTDSFGNEIKPEVSAEGAKAAAAVMAADTGRGGNTIAPAAAPAAAAPEAEKTGGLFGIAKGMENDKRLALAQALLGFGSGVLGDTGGDLGQAIGKGVSVGAGAFNRTKKDQRDASLEDEDRLLEKEDRLRKIMLEDERLAQTREKFDEWRRKTAMERAGEKDPELVKLMKNVELSTAGFSRNDDGTWGYKKPAAAETEWDLAVRDAAAYLGTDTRDPRAWEYADKYVLGRNRNDLLANLKGQ